MESLTQYDKCEFKYKVFVLCHSLFTAHYRQQSSFM